MTDDIVIVEDPGDSQEITIDELIDDTPGEEIADAIEAVEAAAVAVAGELDEQGHSEEATELMQNVLARLDAIGEQVNGLAETVKNKAEKVEDPDVSATVDHAIVDVDQAAAVVEQTADVIDGSTDTPPTDAHFWYRPFRRDR